MSYREEQMLEAWKNWLLDAVHRKFADRKVTLGLLTEARDYLLELIDLTFEDDPDYKNWKKNIDVETGMDEVTEKPFYRIVWKEEDNDN